MSRLKWGEVGSRFYEAGVDRGVLYVGDNAGVVWNGLISVTESPSGADVAPRFIDGVKYLNHSRDKDFKGKLEAYASPYEFDECDGSIAVRNGLFATQQVRKSFNLSYRTSIGNDVDGFDKGYKIHLIYNATAVPSDKEYKTFSDNADTMTLSWDLETSSVSVAGASRTSHLVIDSTLAYSWAIEALENVLYGTATTPARFPTTDEVISLFEDSSILKITDNGDGSWTAEGPDSIITMLDATTFQIDWSSAIPINSTTYLISSL